MDARHADSTNPFTALWLVFRMFTGPLAAPLLIANVIGYAWLYWQGWRSFLDFLQRF